MKPILRASTCLLPLLFCGMAAAQAPVNETPGIAKTNHTAYVYEPYKWVRKFFDIDAEVTNFVGPGKMNDEGKPNTGQQYSVMIMMERNKPTKDSPAKICTVDNFRDLINKNKDDMGVLAISSHGNKTSFAVEPFGDDAGAEKRRDDALAKYLRNGYLPAEIEGGHNEDGYDISVTTKFIEKYRSVGQTLLFLGACEGSGPAKAFVGNGDTTARVALGPPICPTVAAVKDFARLFFSDLDGQPRKDRSDGDRQKFRAVGPAVEAENKFKRGSSAQFAIQMVLTGDGKTTLNPAVREGDDFAFPCPLKDAKNFRIIFDTNMDMNTLPKKNDLTVAGIVIGDPKWAAGNVLEVPITAVNNATNYSLKLPGGKVKSAKNVANIDGNTIPAANMEGAGINAQGPAFSQAAADDYFVEFKECKRLH